MDEPDLAQPPPGPPPAEGAPAGPAWEDRPALAFSALVVAGSLLPWYAGQPPLSPTREALAAAALGLVAFSLLALRRSPGAEPFRRAASLVVGAVVVALGLYVATQYYRFHAADQPRLGAVGHLAYLGPGLDLTVAAALLLAWTGVPTRRPAPAPAPRLAPVEDRLRWPARVGLPLIVFLVAFSVYHEDVERPSIIDFDEAHYVRVAVNMTDGVLLDPGWGDGRPFNFEHPPVGKYLIALGYALAGEPHDALAWPDYKDLCDTDNPACARDAAAWRAGSVWVGSLGVVGMYWLGLRLFRSVPVGVTAAALLLTDTLYFLHSRIAMLDIFPVGLALLAFGVYLGPRRWHPWVGSALFGLAVASKHTGLFLAPPFFVLVFLTSRHTDRWMRLRDALIRVLILPGAVYALTYAPYLWIWNGQGGARHAVGTLLHVHQEAFRWTYRAEVSSPHPYVSEPWTWIPMRRPVFYFVGYDADHRVGHIYALGNPAVWWLGSVALLYTVLTRASGFVAARPRWGLRAFWEWLGRPFHLGSGAALVVSALFFAGAYAPFFLLQRDPFNFYFVVAAPFLSLALAGQAGPWWSRGGPARLGLLAMLGIAAALFAFLHPVVAGTYIDEADFQYIMHRVPGMRQ